MVGDTEHPRASCVAGSITEILYVYDSVYKGISEDTCHIRIL
jgi:hypothetical protein